MTGRSPEEAHRVATPLELFFDLVFVVAVAQVSSELHHGTVRGRRRPDLLPVHLRVRRDLVGVIGFTWFASAYDIDDVAYRLTVFVQLAGAPGPGRRGPARLRTTGLAIVLAGYVIMRIVR
jgi:low temperature requirement protein LtrA